VADEHVAAGVQGRADLVADAVGFDGQGFGDAEGVGDAEEGLEGVALHAAGG